MNDMVPWRIKTPYSRQPAHRASQQEVKTLACLYYMMDANTLFDIKQIFNEGKEEYRKGLFKQALVKWNSAFEKFRESGNSNGMAELLYHIAMVQKKLGQFQEAVINFKESLELYQFLKKERRVALVLHALGVIHAEIDEDDIAWRYFDEASGMYQNMDDKKGMASILHEIGNINIKKNEITEAKECFQKSMSIHQDLDDQVGIGMCHYGLALCAFKENTREELRDHLRKANSIFRETMFIEGSIKVKALLGAVQLRYNDYNNAEKTFNECMRLIAEKYFRTPEKSGINDKKEEVNVLLYMGELFLKDASLNLPDIGEKMNLKAYNYFKEAADLAQHVKFKEGKCQAYFNMGLILFDRYSSDDIAKSTENFSNALEIAKDIRNNELMTKCLLFLGINSRRLRQFDRSLTYFQDCSIFAKRLNYKRLETRTHIERYKVYFDIGHLSDGLENLQAAMSIATEHDFKDLKGDILCLQGDYFKNLGDLGTSLEKYQAAKVLFEDLFNKKGIIKALYGLSDLNEQQGYFGHSISILDEIEALLRGTNDFWELSKVKLEKARLLVLAGDATKALEILEKEVDFLEGISFTGSNTLAAEAKFMIFHILKDKNDIIQANELFKEILEFYMERDRLNELFDIFIDTAYESIEEGNAFGLDNAIHNLWKLLKSNNKMDSAERVVFFLHLLGLIHQFDGKMEYARTFFTECLSVINSYNLVDFEAVILAQIGYLSYLEGKEEAFKFLTDALKKLPEHGFSSSRIGINSLLGKMYFMKGDLDKSLEMLLEATQLMENEFILKGNKIQVDPGNQFRFYHVEDDLYKTLAGYCLEKYIESKDDIYLHRSLTAVQFNKIKKQHMNYFSRSVFKIYKYDESIQDAIDKDEELCQQAIIKNKTMNFLINNQLKQSRLLHDKEVNRDFVKKSIKRLKHLINLVNDELSDLIVDIKKNRVRIMRTQDPGSYLPFLGFDLIKSINDAIPWQENVVILDYAVLPAVSRLAIFVIQEDSVDVMYQPLSMEFLDITKKLEDASANDNQPEILLLHRKLTTYLFHESLWKKMKSQDTTFIMACPDPLFQHVSFNLFGEENDVTDDFAFFLTPNLLNLKILLENKNSNPMAPMLDFCMIFPDSIELASANEIEHLHSFFEKQEKLLGDDASTFLFLIDKKANYANMMDLSRFSPRVIHFSGLVYTTETTPLKGFFNMNDRMFFFENALELELEKRGNLLTCSLINDNIPSNYQVFTMWRTFSLIYMPNLLFSLSRFGYSGLFYKQLYEHLSKGSTLGKAYQKTMNELRMKHEVSNLAWGYTMLIGNPFWTLK